MPISLRLNEHRTLLVVVDLILVNLTTLFAFWIMAVRAGWLFDSAYVSRQVGWFVFLSALWVSSAFLNGFYDPQRVTNLTAAATALFRTVALIIIVYLFIYFFSATPEYLPRGVVGYQGAASFVLITAWRALYGYYIQRPTFGRKVIIIGAGWAGQTIAQAIQQYAPAHYRIVGFVDDDPTKDTLGASRDLARLVKEHQAPEVILAISHNLTTTLFQALMDCKEQGAQITLMPVLYEQLTGQIPIEHIGDNWNVALPLESKEASGFYPFAKRAFDIVGALIGLIVLLPFLPLVALAIWLDSPGPIFYTQVRVGKGGKVFYPIKLRTMVANAEPDGHAHRAQVNDPRVTRVGRWLRKMRLDEMPQLLNVLQGDMSAVGPRPERPEHLAELDAAIPFHRLRNAVKPGMAGWAVVNYDYIDSIEDARIRLQYDLYYIKHQSLALDVLILLRTMGHMFALRGR
ncbi:MAG: sugar transferase [Chloroflexi bacterium]|nr:sugar transferase [Chloroflexota bacterium]